MNNEKQREIKFRAWWKDAEMMVSVERLGSNGSIGFFVSVDWGKVKTKEFQVLDEPEQYELMQYTGLQDKHGKEIYEGDIVTATERKQRTTNGNKRVGIVYLLSGGFELFDSPMSKFCTQDDMQTIRWYMWRSTYSSGHDIYWELVDFEVIGNIHENPELLEKTEDE